MDASETRVFRRSRWFVTFYLVAPIGLVVVGLLMVFAQGDRSGIPVCAVGVVFSALSVWLARTPYVTVTARSLTAHTSPSRAIKIVWEDVLEARVKACFIGGALAFVLKNSKPMQVPLGYLAKGDRHALVKHVQDILATRTRPDGDGSKKDAFS